MLEKLRMANIARQKEWPGNEHADVPFRALEVAGEAGEVAEAIKKWLRDQRGIKGSTLTLDDVADEMGDLLISLDLLANELGIDLADAVAAKFNKTSEKYGLATRLRKSGHDGARAMIEGIAAICESMNASGYTHTPRIVRRAEFDLSGFDEQKSDMPGIDVEYVDQRGPGPYGDEFHGTMAFPFGEYMFVIGYN